MVNFPDQFFAYMDGIASVDAELQIGTRVNKNEYYTRSKSSFGYTEWKKLLTNADVDVELWSGTWTTGSITVPGLQNYTIFRITMVGQGTDIIATRHTQYLRGTGGYCRSTSDASIYFLAATVSGNTISFGACTAWNMGKQSWDAMTVTGIYGIS